MIESVENAIQLITTGICTVIAARKGIFLQKRAWIILALASGVFFLGDLYWELFLVLYGDTPRISYIPYLSWYASFLFLLLLLFELRDTREEWKHRKLLWIIPVFTAGMCLFYMQYGDWIGNIVVAVLMALMLWHSIEGLLLVREKKISCPEEKSEKAGIYILIILLCAEEYAAWTSSCFWSEITWSNPYLWCDILLSVLFLIFPAALQKAVDV